MRWVVVLALFAAGCAAGAGDWSKPGATEEALAQDISGCRQYAQLQAERESFRTAGRLRAPVYEVDPSTGTVRESFSTERAAASIDEASRRQQLFEQCMRDLGYSRDETQG